MMARDVLKHEDGLAGRWRFAEVEFVGSYVIRKNVGLALHFFGWMAKGNYNISYGNGKVMSEL